MPCPLYVNILTIGKFNKKISYLDIMFFLFFRCNSLIYIAICAKGKISMINHAYFSFFLYALAYRKNLLPSVVI